MKIIDDIIQREGGYVNHAADRGGPTNHGITQATLSNWRGHPVTIDAVKNLTREEAVKIYLAEYVKPWAFAESEVGIYAHLLDMGVNHGIGTASKILQSALKVTADGAIGPNTLKAYRASNKIHLELRLVAERAIKMARIVKATPSQSVFIEGWMIRCMSFLTGEH